MKDIKFYQSCFGIACGTFLVAAVLHVINGEPFDNSLLMAVANGLAFALLD